MKQAINTRTQEEYDALIDYINETNGGKVFADWTAHHENTCVNPETLSCASVDFYKKLGIPIIPYTEFAKTIKPEPDYQSMFNEAKGLLEEVLNFSKKETHPTEEILLVEEIKQFLTNHKDGEI